MTELKGAMHSVNLNDSMKVKITPKGKEVFAAYYRELRVEPPAIKRDANGWSEFQIWSFFQIFGPAMFLGCDTPCETEVLVQVREQPLQQQVEEFLRVNPAAKRRSGKSLTVGQKAINLLYNLREAPNNFGIHDSAAFAATETDDFAAVALKTQRERDAGLVMEMLERVPFKNRPLPRAALTLAARAILRGRHLTPQEQLQNLYEALDEFEKEIPSNPRSAVTP